MPLSLAAPDGPELWDDPNYSPEMKTMLTRGYELVDKRDFKAARESLTRCLDARMSAAQRLRLLYALSRADRGLQLHERAADSLDSAIELAIALADFETCAALAEHNGTAHYERQNFRAAAEYFDLSHDAMRACGAGALVKSESHELVALSRQAAYHFLLARYDEALEVVEQARRLMPRSPESKRAAASIEWTAALLKRWSGKLHEALECAENALRYYDAFGAPNEQARLHTVLADILLDMAARHAADVDRGRYHELLAQARSSIMEGLALSQVLVAPETMADEAAFAMALLAFARYKRAMNPATSQLSLIAAAERVAQRTEDLPLLGQVYTALGDELLARGATSEAVAAYNRALTTFRETETPALAVWAERALRRLEEMR